MSRVHHLRKGQYAWFRCQNPCLKAQDEKLEDSTPKSDICASLKDNCNVRFGGFRPRTTLVGESSKVLNAPMEGGDRPIITPVGGSDQLITTTPKGN